MKKIVIQIVIIFILAEVITAIIEVGFKNLWIYEIAFPEQFALQDFQFEDFAFSTRKTQGFKDEDIVLVNIGDVTRRETAEQIDILNEYSPKVIALNVFFNCPDGLRDSINCPQVLDTAANRMLSRAISKSKNVVMNTRLLQTKSKQKYFDSLDNAGVAYKYQYDSLELCDPEFSNYSSNGFANLITYGESDARMCRSFVPMVLINKKPHYAFALEVCRKFDSLSLNNLNFDNDMWINYRGNISIKNSEDTSYNYRRTEYYNTLDVNDVLKRNFKPEEIKDKIVLMGYLGDYLSDRSFEDIWYSPLNQNPLGKSLPDMYGLVIHANIISMIIHDDLITKMSLATSFWLSFFIILANILLFIYVEKKETVWKEVFVIIIPASQIILIAIFKYLAFTLYNHVIDLPITTDLVSVSLATSLYFGPILYSRDKIKTIFSNRRIID